MRILRFAPVVLWVLLCQCKGEESYRLSETDCIPVFSDDSCRYITNNDRQRFAEEYSGASLFYSNKALACNRADRKWGYIDRKGAYLYPAVYTRATIFQENRAWVVRPGEAPCAIDSKGNLKLTLTRVSCVTIYCDGLAAFAQKGSGGERWGYIDKAGNTVIAPSYREASLFADGLAAVKNEQGLWGYIDKEGTAVIPFQYKSAESFSPTLHRAVVQLEAGKYQVIKPDGGIIWETECDHLATDGDRFRIAIAGKWGWCDADGETLIEPQFDESLPFGNFTLAPVKIRGKWGYIDRKGRWKIKRQFTEAYPFFGERAAVRTGTLYGFIDEKGIFRINPQYDSVSEDYLQQALGEGSSFTSVRSDHAQYK